MTKRVTLLNLLRNSGTYSMYTMIVIVTKHLKILFTLMRLQKNLDLYVHTKLPVFNKKCTRLLKKVTKVSTLNKILNKKNDKQKMPFANT